MSGPQGSEPTRPWTPPPESRQPGAEEAAETPWWQQVRRRQPPAPSYPPRPQSPLPYQQAPPQQAPYSPPQYAQQPAPYSYQQPGGAAPASAAQPKHTTRWLLIAGGALVGLVAAVVLALVLFGFDRKELNVAKAQEAVKQVITDPVTGYGIENVTNVRCNNGENPSAKEGDTFTCEVTVDGQKREVRAVFIDDNGTYEVDRPR